MAVRMLPESQWSHPSSLVVDDAGEKPDDEGSVEEVCCRLDFLSSDQC